MPLRNRRSPDRGSAYVEHKDDIERRNESASKGLTVRANFLRRRGAHCRRALLGPVSDDVESRFRRATQWSQWH